MTVEKLNETEKIKFLLKTRTAKIILIVFLCFIALPPIVHVVVLLISGVYLLQAGEILLYYGSLVAFGGTALLALVAWKQNKAAEETNKSLANANDKLVALNEKMQDIQMAENKAVIIIESFKGAELE